MEHLLVQALEHMVSSEVEADMELMLAWALVGASSSLVSLAQSHRLAWEEELALALD